MAEEQAQSLCCDWVAMALVGVRVFAVLFRQMPLIILSAYHEHTLEAMLGRTIAF